MIGGEGGPRPPTPTDVDAQTMEGMPVSSFGRVRVPLPIRRDPGEGQVGLRTLEPRTGRSPTELLGSVGGTHPYDGSKIRTPKVREDRSGGVLSDP